MILILVKLSTTIIVAVMVIVVIVIILTKNGNKSTNAAPSPTGSIFVHDRSHPSEVARCHTCSKRAQMNCSLNYSKSFIQGFLGEYHRAATGDARSSDYSSYS